MRSPWHNLTHRHVTAYKHGLGEVLLCTSRRTGRMDAEVRITGRAHPVVLNDITTAELADLAAADNATQLSLTASRLIRDRQVIAGARP